MESVKIWKALKVMVDEEINRLTKDCVRRKKYTVTTAYDSTSQTIGVTEAFGEELFIPCLSTLSAVEVGTSVWCEWCYSASNMIAVKAGDAL